MCEEKKALTKQEWSKHCQIDLAEKINVSISNDNVPCWSKEMLNLTSEGEKCCEMGCGTGQTSAYLAKYNRIMTSIDYSEDSIILVNKLSKYINRKIDTKILDVTKELPFRKNEFDTIFQCGLLEHFKKNEQINMLKNWSQYSKKMISMVPNAASLPYRIGKKIMEDNNTWEYGLEIPQFSLREEFMEAGYYNIKEYTIGTEHALNFLPQNHYLRNTVMRLLSDNFSLDNIGQGYLLVTIGLKRC